MGASGGAAPPLGSGSSLGSTLTAVSRVSVIFLSSAPGLSLSNSPSRGFGSQAWSLTAREASPFCLLLSDTLHWPAAAATESLHSCPTLCDPQTAAHQTPPSLGFSSKNTSVCCHFLLQCVKVKSKSEVAQSCLTLSDPVDSSLPGSSVHGIFQASVLEWGAIAFS